MEPRQLLNELRQHLAKRKAEDVEISYDRTSHTGNFRCTLEWRNAKWPGYGTTKRKSLDVAIEAMVDEMQID